MRFWNSQGAHQLPAVLEQIGQALQARRLTRERSEGALKAIVAVAASMLTAIYHMLKDRVAYKELGTKPIDPARRRKTLSKLMRRLERLTGAKVVIALAVEQLAA